MASRNARLAKLAPVNDFVVMWIRLVTALFLIGLTGCSSLLYYPSPSAFTDPKKFQHPPEDVFFETPDGLKLHAWYFHSPKRPALATILFFHGNGQNLTTHFFSLYWSLEDQFDYLIFDYRGYGLSEGKPSPEGTVIDGETALAWLQSHRDPASKLILFGQSLGGAVALRVACERPEAYSAIAVDSTFASYRQVARRAMANGWITWPFQWLGWLLMSDTYAPKDCLEKIAPHPLLVIHGTSDRVVDFELGKKIYESARAPKTFWQVVDGHHTDFVMRSQIQARERLVDWLREGPEKNEEIVILSNPPQKPAK